MDDGGRNSSQGRGMVFDISGFDLKGQQLLYEILSKKFSCLVSLHRRSETNTKLCVNVGNTPRSRNLIRPYIIPSMQYKLTC